MYKIPKAYNTLLYGEGAREEGVEHFLGVGQPLSTNMKIKGENHVDHWFSTFLMYGNFCIKKNTHPKLGKLKKIQRKEFTNYISKMLF